MLRQYIAILSAPVLLWAAVSVGCSDAVVQPPMAEGGGGAGEGGDVAMGGTASDIGGGGTGGVPTCPELNAKMTKALELAYDDTLKGGVAIAVRTKTCPLWLKTIGDDTLTPDATIKVVSVSEMLLATTVMLLIEDGLLALDDTVDAWFPSLPNADTMTIRNLLNHTTGLLDYFQDDDHFDAVLNNVNYPWSAAELIGVSADNPPNDEPGGTYDNNFVDSIILGEIASALTSMPIEALIRARVLEPLGATNTYLLGPEGSVAFVVQGYNEEGTALGRLLHPNNWGVAASYASTMEDTVMLVDEILTSDLLTPASREQMIDLSVPTGFLNVAAGLGIDISDANNRRLIGQDGALLGYELRAFYSPAYDASVVVFSNNDGAVTLAPLEAVFDILRDSQQL